MKVIVFPKSYKELCAHANRFNQAAMRLKPKEEDKEAWDAYHKADEEMKALLEEHLKVLAIHLQVCF